MKILYGILKGGITKYYTPNIATETWNFKINPVISSFVEIETFIILSGYSKNTKYINIQIYEKIANTWIQEIGIGLFKDNIITFTLSNGINGKITFSSQKCKKNKEIFIERFTYSTQNFYSKNNIEKIISFVDYSSLVKKSKNFFITKTGINII